MDILRPGFNKLQDGDDATRKRQLEKEAVLISLENLMSFPFIQKAVADDTLSLHGLWNNIGDGGLEAYDPATQEFVAI